jgi:hypothetical protein
MDVRHGTTQTVSNVSGYLLITNLSNRALHGLTVLQLEGEALHLR